MVAKEIVKVIKAHKTSNVVKERSRRYVAKVRHALLPHRKSNYGCPPIWPGAFKFISANDVGSTGSHPSRLLSTSKAI